MTFRLIKTLLNVNTKYAVLNNPDYIVNYFSYDPIKDAKKATESITEYKKYLSNKLKNTTVEDSDPVGVRLVFDINPNIEDNSDKKATIIKNGSVYKITCYNAIETYNKKATCSTTSNLMAYQSSGLKRMYDAFNIEAIYVVDALEFKNLSEDKLKSVLQFFDGSTISYLKSIDRSTIDPKNDTYTDLIIVKIKTEEGYVFGRSERTEHN